MYVEHLPRYVTSALVEETEVGVIVTWKLGDVVPTSTALHFGYEVAYTNIDGRAGKRFGVRFPSPTAFVWDGTTDAHADYEHDHINATEETVIVYFRDAEIGVREVGAIHASSHVNGVDAQQRLPVLLLR